MDKAVKKLLNEFLSAQFLRFFVSALAAAAVNFIARLLLDPYVGYNKAIVLSYLIGTVFAFFLYQREVFGKGARPLWQETGLFVFVTLSAVAQTLIVSVALADHVFPAIGWHWYGKEVAHIIGMGVPMFSSYLGHKYLTFSHEPVEN
ncbi:MAG TPA: GtrA family protein [Pseudomonadales bacterium]|nr:GtrA family protein [Pseudomonadales bacterium]